MASINRSRDEDGIDILSLSISYQEKVLSKVAVKEYFYLQQTCRYIGTLIKNSPYISIVVDDPIEMDWEKTDGDEAGQLVFRYSKLPHCKSFQGVRATSLRFLAEDQWESHREHFDVICETIKRNRITSKCLSFGESALSKKQCTIFMNIVKPEEVWMNSEGFDIYKALWEANLPKRVKLELAIDADLAVDVMAKLLPMWEEISMIPLAGSPYTPNFSDFTKQFAQLLTAESFPNLRKYWMYLLCIQLDKFPTIAKLLEEYQTFNPTVIENKRKRRAILCQFPNTQSCYKVIMTKYRTDIQYEVEYEKESFP